MPRKGEYGDTTQRCAYCGKAEVRWFWSISSPFVNRHYCSLKCSAKDNQSLNLVCSLCVLPISIPLSIGFFIALISRSEIDVANLMMGGIVLLFQLFMLYTVYLGRKP